MKRTFAFALLFVFSVADARAAGAGMSMPASMHAVFVDHLEWQGASTFEAEIEGWYGDAISKFAYRIETEKAANEHAESVLQLGLRQASSPFWDFGTYLRRSFEDDEHRTWFGAGLSGTAPYFVHMDAMLFTGQGEFLLDLEFKRDLPLSRHWVLDTTLALEAMSGKESGISEIELGLRFRYERPDRFSTYAGLAWETIRREDEQRLSLVVGISYWY